MAGGITGHPLEWGTLHSIRFLIVFDWNKAVELFFNKSVQLHCMKTQLMKNVKELKALFHSSQILDRRAI